MLDPEKGKSILYIADPCKTDGWLLQVRGMLVSIDFSNSSVYAIEH